MRTYFSLMTAVLLVSASGCGVGANPDHRNDYSVPLSRVSGDSEDKDVDSVPLSRYAQSEAVRSRDLSLMSKALSMGAQCLILTLEGFEFDDVYYDREIGIVACRLMETPTLDGSLFLGSYDARTKGYLGSRADMALVLVDDVASDVFDPDREDIVGAVNVYEINTEHNFVRGDVLVESSKGSGNFVERTFQARFLGYFLHTIQMPSPRHVWEGR